MEMEGTAGFYATILAGAAEYCGGRKALAALLRVPLEDLTCWLTGAEKPPLAVFMDALDIVGAGPQRHRITEVA
jgi:hypothetical protein